MRKGRWWMIAALLTAACLGRAQRPGKPRADGGAYAELDSKRLAETLSEMGMTELLEKLLVEGAAGQSVSARAALVEASIAGAQKALDLQARNRLLDRAIVVLEGIVTDTQQASQSDELLEHFGYQLKLAETRGIVRVKPYVLRLRYLQGGEEDKAVIVSMTDKAVKRLEGLSEDVREELENARDDLESLMIDVPKLENLHRQITYKLGWLSFYRGMALPVGAERTKLLNGAINAVDGFVREKEQTGWGYWSSLLTGMAFRELKDHAAAAGYLSKAGAPEAAKAVRIEAMFETARNLAEQGETLAKAGKSAEAKAAFERAVESVDAFRCGVVKLLGPESQLQADIQTAMLLNYLYGMWAAAESGPKKTALQGESVKALLDFYEKYSDRAEVRGAFFNIIATKFRGRTDHDKLNSMALLALAMQKIYPGSPEKEQQLGEEMLNKVMTRGDPISLKVRPLAMWQLAMLMNRRRLNVAAAKWFERLAREFPTCPSAFDSAMNAVITYKTVLQDLGARNRPVGIDLRKKFVSALNVLLDRWATKPGAARWYFALGEQQQEIAEVVPGPEKLKWVADSIEAYEKVPPNLVQHMDARYRALKLRSDLLALSDASPSAERRMANELVTLLEAYSAEAAKAVEHASDRELADELRRWGARTDFLAGEILYERLNQTESALAKIRQLSQKWPGTPVLQEAAEFEIRKLVEAGRIDQAIGKVDEFRRKYDPDEAQQLIELIVKQIRKRIEALEGKVGRAAALERYRKVFLRFAEDLFTRAEKFPAEQAYPFRLMYADALLENGKADEALKQLKLLEAYDSEQRGLEAAKIDAVINELLKAAEAAKGDRRRLAQTARRYFELLGQYGFQRKDFGKAEQVGNAVAYLEKAPESPQQGEQLDALQKLLVKALEDLRPRLKRTLAMQYATINGLAKAYRLRKEYPKAVEFFNELVGGIDKTQHPKLYWASQLDLCECILEGWPEEKETMKKLMLRIRHLREFEDPLMGGLYGRFKFVEDEAAKLLRQITSVPAS